MAKSSRRPAFDTMDFNTRPSNVQRTTARREKRQAERDKRTARAFEAGRTGRRLRAIPTSSTAINAQIRSYGRNVVSRSRYLCANNSYAAAAKESYMSALVGTGIKPSPLVKDKTLKKALQRHFARWTDEADADGLTDFYGLQGIVASEMFEAGEVFVRLRPRLARDGLAVPLQLQLLPSEMLPYEKTEVLANGGRIDCGIEFNAIGQRVAYHFLTQHPGELLATALPNTQYTVRVPATEVLHLFKPIRAGQIRGIPHTIAGIVTLALLDLYDDAELERKRTAALFAAFVTREKGESDDEHPFEIMGDAQSLAGDEWNSSGFEPSDFSLEPGAVVDLLEGQDVKFAEPADVGTSYEAFQYRNLLRAASGFGVPYLDMTGDLRQTSYSSARVGDVKHRRRIEQHQNFIMIFQFCRPIWNRVVQLIVQNQIPMDAEDMTGGTESEDEFAEPAESEIKISPSDFAAAPWKFLAVKWQTPKWDWVDPYKDLLAEKLAVDAGFKARSDVVEAMGYDPEETDERIRADQLRATDMDLKFIQLSGSVVFAPDDAEEPEPPALPGELGVDSGDESGDESTDDGGEPDFG